MSAPGQVVPEIAMCRSSVMHAKVAQTSSRPLQQAEQRSIREGNAQSLRGPKMPVWDGHVRCARGGVYRVAVG